MNLKFKSYILFGKIKTFKINVKSIKLSSDQQISGRGPPLKLKIWKPIRGGASPDMGIFYNN